MANQGTTPTERDVERFWSKVDRGGPGDCWEWQGGRNHAGYGKFWIQGRTVAAHRASYWIKVGHLPPSNRWLLHSCDNPSCVNPEHLREGSPGDNSQDMTRRMRQARGERHGMTSLNSNLVMAIRYAWLGGISGEAIGKLVGITAAAVSSIVRRRSWAHLPDVEDFGPVVRTDAPATRKWKPPPMPQSGSNHYASKLTEENVSAIRKLAADGSSLKSICDEFSLSQGHVSRIVSRNAWKSAP